MSHLLIFLFFYYNCPWYQYINIICNISQNDKVFIYKSILIKNATFVILVFSIMISLILTKRLILVDVLKLELTLPLMSHTWHSRSITAFSVLNRTTFCTIPKKFFNYYFSWFNFLVNILTLKADKGKNLPIAYK